MRINIGFYHEKAIELDTERAVNSHILCIGTSGSGKTVEAQHIISGVVRQGGTVLAISAHSSLAASQIYTDYAGDFSQYGNYIFASTTGIPCPLFTPLLYPDGKSEAELGMIEAVTDIVCRALKLGIKDRVLLRRAVEYAAKAGAYHSGGIHAIGEALSVMEERGAAELYERLRPLFLRNVFVDGDSFIKEGCINVIYLDKFDLQMQDKITEMLLAYIWRLGNAHQFEEHPIFLFLDECQNANAGANAPLACMLSEGRKLGIRLILATQMLFQGSNNAAQKRLTQCGTILVFKPARDCIRQTAKLVDPEDGKHWYENLRTLKVGEFVACGSLVIAGREIDYPVIVRNKSICKTEDSE